MTQCTSFTQAWRNKTSYSTNKNFTRQSPIAFAHAKILRTKKGSMLKQESPERSIDFKVCWHKMKPKCFCSLQLGLFVLLLSSIITQIGRFFATLFLELIESTVTNSPKNSGLNVGLPRASV